MIFEAHVGALVDLTSNCCRANGGKAVFFSWNQNRCHDGEPRVDLNLMAVVRGKAYVRSCLFMLQTRIYVWRPGEGYVTVTSMA